MEDLGTTARLLAALSLLQARPHWPGPELAERLGVTVRTVRRDVERLRQLGYPVLAATGVAGGYRLGAGGRAMPPLMLDRDEAVAVAVCLRSTAADTIAGGGEAGIRALGKLEQLLPPTLRRQVGTIGSMTSRLGSAAVPVEPDVLVAITRACRDAERLRVRYRDARGNETDRTLDPYRVVSTAKRWYLVARDRDRADWRTFRVDRLVSVRTTGHRIAIVDPPDPVAFVQRAITTAPYRHQARIELDSSVDSLLGLVPPNVGLLEPIDDGRTMLTTGADSLDLLTFHLLALGVDFHIHETEALRAHIAIAARRLAAATTPAGAVATSSVDAVSPSHDEIAEATAATEAVMRPQSVPINVYETPAAVVVVAPFPAVTASDVSVEVRPGDPPTMRFWSHVRSSGTREYLVHEWEYGGYERQIDIPAAYGAGVEATLHSGQLVVRLLRGDVTGPLTISPS